MDPDVYEKECLARVKERLTWARTQLNGYGRTIEEVTLRGSHPGTEIVVVFEEYGHRREDTWRIWDLPLPQTPEAPWDPETIATIVYAHMTEP